MRMRTDMRVRFLVVMVVLAAAAVATATPSASAAPRWAPASKATIHPGVRTTVSGTTCTTNFVFYDAHAVYLGQAASCAASSGVTDGGADETSTPSLGTKVKIQGASRPGTLVYNSWLTMGAWPASVGERSNAAHWSNDFALVRLDNADKGRVNPSVPVWGGPISSRGRSSLGNPMYSYGTSSPRGVLTPRVGIDTTAINPDPLGGPFGSPFRPTWGTNGGWDYYMHAVTPGLYEDVGSAVLDARGRALGILSGHLVHDLSNKVTDLSKAIAYMKVNTSLDSVQLAKGTAPFLPPR